MKRHNWKLLTKEWLTGEYASLADMARAKSISYRVLQGRSHKLRWPKMCAKEVENIAQKAENKIIARLAALRTNVIAGTEEYSDLFRRSVKGTRKIPAGALSAALKTIADISGVTKEPEQRGNTSVAFNTLVQVLQGGNGAQDGLRGAISAVQPAGEKKA